MTARTATGLIASLLGIVAVIWTVRSCRPTSSDVLVLRHGTDADAVAFVDGRTKDGCTRDLIATGRELLTVGNMMAPRGCHSELTVFQFDRAMYNEKRDRWSDGVGDRVTVDMSAPLRQVDVVIRLTAEMNEADKRRAINDLARANQLFNVMRCGIRFSTVSVTKHNEIRGFDTCGLAEATNKKVEAKTGMVNVYYTRKLKPKPGEVAGPRGVFCIDPYATVIITRSSDNDGLAHELGHVLSLEDSAAEVDNIMNEHSWSRRLIAEGQCFRCNKDVRSFLNWKGTITTLPARSCPQGAINEGCPPANRTSRIM